MDGLWASACEAWPYGERLFVATSASAVHATVTWLSCAFFVFLDATGWGARFKLPRPRPCMDPALPANVARDKKAFWEQVLGTVVVVPFVVWLAAGGVQARGIAVCGPGSWPRPMDLLKDVCLLIVACDVLFYWTHRLLHENTWLYRNVHKQHHEYVATNAWASEYFGPADMLLNILPGVLPAVVFKTPFASLLVFTALRMWQTVQSHGGYDLPFDPLNWWPFFTGGARRHDFHHSHNAGCFGDWCPFWDWACGTDAEYRRHWKGVAEVERRRRRDGKGG